MSRVQWRRFAFFEKDSVDENITDALGSSPTCASADGGMLLFGDNDGNITLADRNFKLLWKCKAFKGEVKGLAYVYDPLNHRKQYVFAVGDEFVHHSGESASAMATMSHPQETFYMMKIFNANDMSRPLHVFHASPGVTPTATVTAFSVLGDGCQIALGFSTGTLLLFSGNFVKNSGDGNITMVSNNRCYTPEVLLQRERQDRQYYPIASVHFCELPAAVPVGGNARDTAGAQYRAAADRKIRLFAVMNTEQPLGTPAGKGTKKKSAQVDDTDTGPASILARELDSAGIVVFDTSLSGANQNGFISPGLRRIPHVVDEVCGSVGGSCAAYMEETRELVVARAEGVFSYNVEDRGGAAGIEGHKQCIGAIGRYVLVSSVDLDKMGNAGASQRSSITIYDLRNKFVSFYYQLPQGDRVLHCLQDGNMAYIITSSWALLRFTEKDATSKLEVLLRKSLYPLAIALAAEEQQDAGEIMKLYKLYGDHLFKKGEHDAAMSQYCATIGYVQPSYVIKRFLDINLMTNLVAYLEKLHDRGLASKDHTVLLLSCLTKLRDEEKLLKFASLFEEAGGGSDVKTLQFDVGTAVDTLYESRCVDHASRLALKFEQHDSYIKMQLYKEEPDAAAVLAYMVHLLRRVPMETVLALTLCYGADLLLACPAVFTGFLVRCCTGQFEDIDVYMEENLGRTGPGVLAAASSAGELTEPTEVLQVDDVIGLFVDDDESLLALLEGVYHISDGPGGVAATASAINSQAARALPAKVADTLLELYLRKFSEAEAQLASLKAASSRAHHDAEQGKRLDAEVVHVQAAAREMKRRIGAILDNPQADYDATHALLLVHIYNYPCNEYPLMGKSSSGATSVRCAAAAASQGNLLLLRKYMESNQTRRILKLLRTEGKNDPELYVQALRYFVRKQTHMQKFDDLAVSSRRRRRGRSGADSDDECDETAEGNVASVHSGSDGGDTDADSDSSGESSDCSSDSDSDSDSSENEVKREARRQKEAMKRWKDVVKVLAIVDRDQVLAPVQIISLLAEQCGGEEDDDEDGVPFALISKYVTKSLHNVAEDTEEAERAVHGMRSTVLRLTQEEATRQHLEAQMVRQSHDGQKGADVARGKRSSRGTRRTSRHSGRKSSSSRTIHSVQKNANFNPFLEEDDGDGDANSEEDEDDFDLEGEEYDEDTCSDEGRDSFAYGDGGGAGLGVGVSAAASAKELAKWSSIQKAQQERAGEHESFFSELEQSHNGFNSVAAYFGKTSIVK